jgi:hypothetical protein
MTEDNYEWELVTKDGRKFSVPPDKAQVVKRRWDAKEPIHFANESINYHDIERFNKTTKAPTTVPLLQSAAAAFGEPMLEGDSIKWHWVKMDVSQREYSKFYSQAPGYKSLDGQNGMVTVAFRQPLHQIDPYKTEVCTQDEITRLQ